MIRRVSFITGAAVGMLFFLLAVTCATDRAFSFEGWVSYAVAALSVGVFTSFLLRKTRVLWDY